MTTSELRRAWRWLAAGLFVLCVSVEPAAATVPMAPPPEPMRKVQPVYPDSARHAGIRGTVIVQALVGKDGRVREARVIHHVRGLDEVAVVAARKWVFKPELANGQPVFAWVAVPFQFGPRDWTADDSEDSKAASTLVWAVVIRPDSSLSLVECVAFYAARLRDSTYIEYAEDGEPRSWLVAPEELGAIGAPALPLLIQELECSEDVYERTQVFYALRLAAQGPGTEDATIQAELSTVLNRFPSALPPESEHASLKAAWLTWWEHQHARLECSGQR